jgi:alkylation response protein AidB-like acyl-CoA dehydrogenase
MQKSSAQTELEAQLLSELARIERAIAALGAERNALQRALTRARQRRFGNLTVTRRNSHTRILAENEILEALRAAEDHTLSTRQLQKTARTINPEIKPATFRSHLHRMKKRGLIIQKSGRHGIWTLSPSLRM